MPIPRDQVRFCTGCREPRHITSFVPGSEICGVCRECGAKYPEESREPRAASRENADGTLSFGCQSVPFKEGAMSEMVKCDKCGKEVKARGLGVHRRIKHGIRGPRAAGGGQAGRKIHNPKSPIGNRKGRRHGQVDRVVPAGTGKESREPRVASREGQPVWGELLTGRNGALAQSLVEEAIRGGMSLAPACALVARAMGR